jgi:transposase InsO family protein
MPWKTLSLLKVRQRLVQAVLARRQTVQTLARRCGVSRKSAYKWLHRFRQQGLAGLRDQSRRPHRSPGRLTRGWIQAIERVRRARPHWGAKKIHRWLRRQSPRRRLPCVRTIQRWLQRAGWVRSRPRRARRGPAVLHPGLTVARRPNQVWTVDFKGWFRTADGVRQEPLTVRDQFSRYGLCLRLLPNQDDPAVRRVMARLFQARGLPTSIRVDNGSPFGGKGALGLSRLSVWWLRLGIRVEFTRRARPGDNAAHEQFHGCYQREVVAAGDVDRRATQAHSTRWLAQYNQERPHEALGGRTPAQVYRPSHRACPPTLPPLVYPRRWPLRRVRNRGHIKWRGRLRFIGRAFVGQTVSLQPLSPTVQAVYCGKLLIGHLHEPDASGMRPAHWHRRPEPLRL